MGKQFEKLSNFILKEMRMSHIYQPTMLIELLKRNGKASVQEVAKALLVRDKSQVEYYEQITKKYPGKVLTNSRGITRKDRDQYSLLGFDELNSGEIVDLISYCENKIAEYLNDGKDPGVTEENHQDILRELLDIEFSVEQSLDVSFAAFPQTEKHWKSTTLSHVTRGGRMMKVIFNPFVTLVMR